MFTTCKRKVALVCRRGYVRPRPSKGRKISQKCLLEAPENTRFMESTSSLYFPFIDTTVIVTMEFYFLEKKNLHDYIYYLPSILNDYLRNIKVYQNLIHNLFSRWLEMGIKAETFAIFAIFSPLLRKFMSGKKFNNKFLKVIFAK